MVGTLSDRQSVRAAGAVLWRTEEDGRTQVAVVHRPRYDDWSLPKGKLDAGETVPAAAAREVGEETGFACVLGPFLTRIDYSVPASNGDGTVPKTVAFFSAHAGAGAFQPNSEVDDLRWLEPGKARARLSYPMDAGVLDAFTAIGTDLTTVLLVRHAKAGKREGWTGDDDLRPLSESGLRQAAALRRLVPLFGPDRVLSAPRLRCVQTVRAIADDLGTDIEHEPLFSEEAYWRDPAVGMARLLSIGSHGGTPVISSQGKVIPDVIGALALREGMALGRIPSKKGSIWLLSFAPDTDGTGPRLRAANYLPSPLAAPGPGINGGEAQQ
ncbi:MAG: NUDIX hydrolase [Pseudonocardiaceae bacterium]